MDVRSGAPASAPNRRRFLLMAAVSAMAPQAGPLLRAAAPGAAAAGRAGGFVIVNGWVLTEADVALLADHAL